MFNPLRSDLINIKNKTPENMQYITQYLNDATAFNDGERDEQMATKYIAELLEAKCAIEMLALQADAILAVAKENTRKYNESKAHAAREATIFVTKGTKYDFRSGKDKVCIDLRLEINTVDGVFIEGKNVKLLWGDRGSKNAEIGRLTNIASKDYGVTSVRIDDETGGR